jgi:hypothetical protein
MNLSFGVLLLLLAAAPQTALAEAGAESGGEGGAMVGGIRLGGIIRPPTELLSSSSWLASNALNPEAEGQLIEQDPMAGWDSALGPGPAAGAGPRSSAIQQVPFRNPAPAFSRNLLITRQLGYQTVQTEPSISVDPTDPEHLIMGAIDYNLAGNIAVYASFDGGETWEGPNRVRYFHEDFGAAGDPVVAFDRDGSAYLSMISIGIQEFRIGSLVSEVEVSSLSVSKSFDGGITWGEPVVAARSSSSSVSQTDDQGRARGQVTLGFLDKEWISTGPNPNDPSTDSIYMSYTDFESTYGVLYADELPFLSTPFTTSTIKVVRSDDYGATWTQPVAASPSALQAFGTTEGEEGEGLDASGLTPGSNSQPVGEQAEDEEAQQAQQGEGTGESDRVVQGSQPKVLSDGTLVVAYVDSTNDGSQKGLAAIMLAKSSDGGRTFSPPVQAGYVREPHFRTRNTNFRYWGTVFPQLAIGPEDEIYILSTGVPSEKIADDGDIYLFRSFDQGETWEEPVLVNQDDTNRVQFFPSITVSADGVIHAMWGDMRDDPDEVRYHIYYSRSDDKGETFGFTIPNQDFTAPDTRVTDFPSNSLKGFTQGLFIGDYFSIAANEDDVYMVWADTRQGEFSGINQQIGFARQTAIKSPSIFLNPPNGAAGRTVDIQGFDFQPESNIQLLIGGVIVANERTDDEGQFQTRIFMPVTGEGASDVRVFDETGNAATASFYTEFGFDTIQRSLDQINDSLGLEAPPPLASPPAASPVASPAATPETLGAAGPTSFGTNGLPVGGLGLAAGLVLASIVYGGTCLRRRRAWR